MSKLYFLACCLFFLNLACLAANSKDQTSDGVCLLQPEYKPTSHATVLTARRTDSGRLLIEEKEVLPSVYYRNFIDRTYNLHQEKGKYRTSDISYYINGRPVSKEEYDGAKQAQQEYYKKMRRCVIS